MTRQIVFPQSPLCRRQPLLASQDSSERGRTRLAEVAGGTTAECAAVCCCCPCGLVNLLVLTVYKLPAGLCRKVIRRKRRRKDAKNAMFTPRRFGCSETEQQIRPKSVDIAAAMITPESDKEVIELEKEMWGRFYGAGFWRSPSQRED